MNIIKLCGSLRGHITLWNCQANFKRLLKPANEFFHSFWKVYTDA